MVTAPFVRLGNFHLAFLVYTQWACRCTKPRTNLGSGNTFPVILVNLCAAAATAGSGDRGQQTGDYSAGWDKEDQAGLILRRPRVWLTKAVAQRQPRSA